MKNITILGATGSIGMQTKEIVHAYPDDMNVVCISAHENIQDLAKIANDLRPEYVAITGNADIIKLKSMICYDAKILHGKDALVQACTAGNPDIVLLAVLGIAGLPAFEECLKNKITVALANKESLVCGADVTRKMIDETGTIVLPVDSEHSAIFQCLNDTYDVSKVENIWITASGGPFLYWDKEKIYDAPKKNALNHPKWKMGQKITIDSASLANKGLEVIEAHYMYKTAGEHIKVVVHPQSLVHSMIEFKDSSVLAQLGPVDMRLPIQKALLFPKMRAFPLNKPLNFYEISQLDFIEPDLDRFPCLKLAYDAIESKTTAVYNVANEVAVDCYLHDSIKFGEIHEIIEDSMQKFFGVQPQNIEQILSLDKEVREYILHRRRN
ncbi:MAG: 1-deoxy-D-xylulose-5-phosphate reductoisomerase [Christensenellaceae bacterium]